MNTPFDPEAPEAPSRLEEAARSVAALPQERTQLLPAFLAVQHALGWLPRPAIEQVAAHLRVPLSEVYATATAYSELRLERPEPGTWYVCTGIACHLAGSQELIEALPDRARGTDCQFLCALAPVVYDDAERLFGRVTVEDLARRASA